MPLQHRGILEPWSLVFSALSWAGRDWGELVPESPGTAEVDPVAPAAAAALSFPFETSRSGFFFFSFFFGPHRVKFGLLLAIHSEISPGLLVVEGNPMELQGIEPLFILG